MTPTTTTMVMMRLVVMALLTAFMECSTWYATYGGMGTPGVGAAGPMGGGGGCAPY